MKRLHKDLRICIIFLLFFSLSGAALFPCTVAVVSGKATPDGRPLLWKTRDSSPVPNKLVYIKGKNFDYVGIVDGTDIKLRSIWAGINTAGFAIMNSASGDLSEGRKEGPGNGQFMRMALEECSDVADFEKLLKETNGKRNVAANFGVIDAKGNGCFFETSHSSFKKFDSNNPAQAPHGYIIRTNYAFTAPVKDQGGGYIRFERASHLFEEAVRDGRLTHKFILQEAARDLVNEKLHTDPLKAFSPDLSSPLYVNTSDTINRNSTVSVTVFHGAKNPSEAFLSTMWILLGQAITTAAIPVWAHAEGVPEVAGGSESAPLNDFSRAMSSYLYPDKRGHMKQYMDVSRLLGYQEEGILKRLLRIEDQVLRETSAKIRQWEKRQPDKKDQFTFSDKIASWVFDSMKRSFPDIKDPE
jgi:hypothetical protein